MLFYFYLITVIFSVVIVHIMTIFFTERFKQDGIEVLEKPSRLDELSKLVFLFIKVCFPFVNMIYDIYLLGFHNHIYRKMVTQLFLEGKVIFKEDFSSVNRKFSTFKKIH